MLYWTGFSFMSRSRFSRKTREKCQDPSSCSDMVPEHDQSQPSLDPGWSFNGYGGTSFLDHLDRETDTYYQSADSSRHLSLTTASLKRLVKEENAVSDRITPPKTLVPAQTSTSPISLLNNHEPSSSLTAGLTKVAIASTSLLDLYLLQSSSCINAGTTLPSSTVMDGQSGSLSTIEGLVEAYAASERSDDSHAFIHAGELDRQSYVDARRELAAVPAPLHSPGPAPSLLPPPPAYHPAPPRGEDESDEAVPTPPTRILDRAPPPSVSRFLSGLHSGVFDAEESPNGSVSETGQQEEETPVFGEVSFGRYKLFPDIEQAPKNLPSKGTIPPPPPQISREGSTPSLAPTIPLDISGFDDNQDLILERQSEPSPRLLETARIHSLANDTVWLQKGKEGKRKSWALFVFCAIIPFVLLLLALGGFDKVMVRIAGTHARPTLYQKSLAKYLCVVEVVAWPSLVA
ncbi:hypothetical protein E4T52_03361 [Aureobasidium sp. EXF-3400]|nr:hypothetical protein E4T51_02620 [Aureobasidium sp. EXF-12344]KAI4781721.1 hypothetical protein E4T52_03361 [Aureobasidium sp. EXF-3400]